MSDLAIFLIGTGVFAITTTATLLYGYTWFTHKAIEDGVDVGEGWEDAATDPPAGLDESEALSQEVPIGTKRFRRQLSLQQTR